MKIGVVGAGLVGSTAAFAMALQGRTDDILLVDLDRNRAEAEAEDISHAMPFAGSARVSAVDYADLAGAAVIIIAAGVNQAPGETRLDLLARNAAVFKDVIDRILKVVPEPILLIATNPVDIMTTLSQQISGLDPARVIGSGTILDTARFRDRLGAHLGLARQSVHAYVLGEHGDSEVLGWSGARAGTMPLADYAEAVGRPITEGLRAEIDAWVRRAAYRIIGGKGATYYGIGAGLARIVAAVTRDERAVLSVAAMSTALPGFAPTAFSVPRVIGAGGVVTELMPTLNADETRALKASAEMLHETVRAL